MSRSPHPGETHPPVPPDTPIFDAFAYLAYLAGITEQIRLGTHVYNLGLRHPFVAARAVQTLDIVSGRSHRVRDRRELARGGVGRRGARLHDTWSPGRRGARGLQAPLDRGRGRRSTASSSPSRARSSSPSACRQPYPPIHVGGESGAGASPRRACGRRVDRHEPRLRVGCGPDRSPSRAARRRGPGSRPTSSTASAARSTPATTSPGGRTSA